MSPYNPELLIDASDRGSLKRAVEDLFGRSSAPLVKAIGTFLRAAHGTFDEANLRVLAGAAPFLDENHLIRLVQEIPITNLDLPIAPIELNALRANFSPILQNAPKAAQFRLVRTLIRDVTFRTLSYADVPPEGLALGRQEIHRLIMHGSPTAAGNALHNRMALPEHAVIAFGRRGHQFQVAKALATASVTPAEILDQLTSSGSQHLTYLVAGNTHTSPTTLHALVMRGFASSGSPAVFVEPIARNPSAAESTQDRIYAAAQSLRANNQPFVADRLLRAQVENSGISPALLKQIADVITRDDIPSWELLAAQGDLLGNENTPSAAIEVIVASLRPPVTQYIADTILSNSNSPLSAIRRVWPAALPEVLATLVQQRADLDAELLHELGGHHDSSVVLGVTTHANTATRTLKMLKRHDSPYISALARAVLSERSPFSGIYRVERPEPPITTPSRGNIDFYRSMLSDPRTQEPLAILKSLLDQGEELLPNDVNDVLARVDVEDAIRFASTRPLPEGVGVQHMATAVVSRVSVALQNGAVMKASSELREWSDLPLSTPDDFEVPDIAERLDGLEVDGLTGRLMRDTDSLVAASESMGNCLDTYVERARKGSVAIVCFDDPARDERYAAAYTVGDKCLYEIEVNSKRNKSQVPDDFKAELESRIDGINGVNGLELGGRAIETHGNFVDI